MPTWKGKDYMKKLWERYVRADRFGKKLILDEFCANKGCHRKHAIRLLAKGPPPARPSTRRRGSTYSKRVVDILASVWEASGYLCSQRLKPALPLWLPSIRAHYHTTPQEEAQLLAISPSQIDRRLKGRKIQLRRRIYGGTKPGTWLKHIIPIRTGSWRVQRPGSAEMDLVSHSGDSAEGDFAQTLNLTDILTTWTERRCLPVKSQGYVLQAVTDIRSCLPFELKEVDVDSGSEFVNQMLHDYCQREPRIRLTRSRVGKKNDNAHVEQKNFTHVRKWLGYHRYDTPAAVAAIDDLYRNELRWFQNLFQPSMRLKHKHRVGSRYRRVYDETRTPLDRLAGTRLGTSRKVAGLLEMRKRLDPIALSQAVDAKLRRVWALASKTPKPLSRHRAGKLPHYSDKPMTGPPLVPDILPRPLSLERMLEREQRLGTL